MNDGAYSVDPTVVESYTALEPNPFMYGGLQKNAEDNGFCVKYDGETYPDGKGTPVKDYQDLVPFHIVRGTLDDEAQVPTSVLANAPYDTIITSFSLCTARNLQESIRSIVRLLKPGGMYIFIEHIRHPPVGDPLVLEDNGVDGRFWGAMQGIVNPLWRILGHGCEVNRHTAQTIDSTSGWESVEYKYVRIGGDILSYFLPMTFGKAIKARE
ncbi:hypothetical protein GGF46_001650 [Coemansia sp. RSA 552]|nr:hypothetical protein GGF46_001650 [Coemansia sp. RSA 552]